MMLLVAGAMNGYEIYFRIREKAMKRLRRPQQNQQKLNVIVVKNRTDCDPDIQHSTYQSLNIVINSLVYCWEICLAHTQIWMDTKRIPFMKWTQKQINTQHNIEQHWNKTHMGTGETNEGNHVIKAFLLQITNWKHEQKLKLWNGHWDSDKKVKTKQN